MKKISGYFICVDVFLIKLKFFLSFLLNGFMIFIMSKDLY